MKIYDLILRRDDTDAKGRRKPCPKDGYFYELWHKGERLARSQTNVETDAARVLLAQGVKAFRVWRPGKASHEYTVDCEKVAGWQLSEEDRDGFRARRYRNPADDLSAGEMPCPAPRQRRERSGVSAPAAGFTQTLTEADARRSKRGGDITECYF